MKKKELKFHLATLGEVETLNKASLRLGQEPSFGKDKRQKLEVAYLEQDNFTLAVVRANGGLRIGVSKRNPSFRLQRTNIISQPPSLDEGNRIKVEMRKVQDEPNPKVGREIALSRALRNPVIKL